MTTNINRTPGNAALSYQRLVAFAAVLALFLIMLGAYVRLNDAGLGCPDWPGCYGKVLPTQAHAEISAAVSQQGGELGPVSMAKAWREMGHRYLAIVLGILIIAIAVQAWRRRDGLRQSPWLPTALLGTVILQGLFGMWTVTLLLKPAIVTAHLIGGLLTLALLVWLWQRQKAIPHYIDAEPVAALAPLAWVGLGLLALQIVLGGWTSANYAGLACPDLPTCQGLWWPETNFPQAFHILRELGMTGDGSALPLAALTAIQIAHRIGAILIGGFLLWLGWRVATTDGTGALGRMMMAVVAVQIGLGITIVLTGLPLWAAVAHNGVAAVLLSLVVVVAHRATRARLRI